jgi:hypothetical protein
LAKGYNLAGGSFFLYADMDGTVGRLESYISLDWADTGCYNGNG